MPLQVSQNYRTGKVTLDDVGMPALRSGGVIVKSEFSVISPGTEGTKLKEARMSLLEKARARPDQVKQVLDVVRQQGLRAAYQKVINRLEQLTPLGYSVAGHVVAVADDVEDFSIGDRVAAGGAGFANHAEYNFIPRNLLVHLPEAVAGEQAAFTTIGSIAMHAYRQSNIALGEKALVIGLGLVGQLLTQILAAAGVYVVGIDLADERCDLALLSGAVAAAQPSAPQWRNALSSKTGASGADVVFIAAGSTDNSLLEIAAANVRDRGVIVVVGKTMLELDYNVFFKKEIEVRFSRSYGPGRFDPSYEERGIDYPLPYVRWTEQRNMAAFVDLLTRQKLNLAPLMNVMRPFETAVDVFEQVYERQINALGIIFAYGHEVSRPAVNRISEFTVTSDGKPRIGIIGAGNYAASMLLPELKASSSVELAAVVTSTGLSAAGMAQRFRIPAHGTDASTIFADPSIKAVVIATRHSSHSTLVAQALTSGKDVFVEKPLAIDDDGLSLVCRAMKPNSRVMVGFNRRYAPIMQRLAKLCHGLGPMQIVYRVQAGRLEVDAWQNQPEHGGRFIGEAGHFFDIFQFLTGARPQKVLAARLHPTTANSEDHNNISATVTYSNGSAATLHYGTFGGGRIPKEYLEVHCAEQSFLMRNFETLEIFSGKAKPRVENGFGGGKGQTQQMQSFAKSVALGTPMLVNFDDLVETTKLTLLAQKVSLNNDLVAFE
jgi:predicted dehydrogenase/threonine dehydrogenase-like Zn-dependent dehydrogenase